MLGRLLNSCVHADQSSILCALYCHVTCRDPVVVPFFHSGMGRVLPKTFVVPRWGNDITITVGGPINLAEQLAVCRSCRDKETRQQVGVELGGILALFELDCV